METPNTRFRRKREDETPGSSRPNGSQSQEDDRVVWVHDQRLKRAVLLATEHAPPTPTQKPRSICSSARANGSGSNSNSTHPPPRKRPCRPSRSVPSALNAGTARQPTSAAAMGMGRGVGSASAPTSTADGEVKLELLLQRFEALSAPKEREHAQGPGPGSGLDTGKGKEGQGISTPNTRGVLRNTIVNTSRTPNVRTFDQEGLAAGSPITRSAASASTIDKDRAHGGVGPTNRDQAITRPTTIAPSPLSTRPSALAHRLAAPSRSRTITTSSGQKPFKPPFLNQPTRQSPRRPIIPSGNTLIPPSPLRTHISVPVPTTTRTKMSMDVDMGLAETPCRGTNRKHNANVDIGEDEPEGNESFDSFDGMFQEGGPEVEELFRKIDGPQ